MKKPIIIAIACIAVAILAVVIVRQKSVMPPSVIGEQITPQLISDEAWRESIAKDPASGRGSAWNAR
jgi:hypothetical protein